MLSKTSFRSESQPIAICGMGCRLPGGVRSSSDLWSMLAENRSGQCSIPKSRFNIDAFYHPRGLDRPGSVNTSGGYFLQDEDIRQFDNAFFGINNLEATYMDPEQRKLLEVVFECLESAGESLDSISGSNTGCYAGNFSMDFEMMQVKDPEYLNRYSATGMGTTILSSRISHVFNLVGPNFVLDTACSSSLYCLHVACMALQNGECDAAIVAGANLVQSPEQHLVTMKTGVLSPTSTCHTFDSEADGYGRADGVGALYIKRLEDAIRDGDPVRSVIRGSAVNANGRTNGIALPTTDGQEAVIHKAYAKAGLDPSYTTYVECHGTGTSVGDAIEVEALSHAFPRTAHSPLLIGSAKTNVGHSEAASGITSVIKGTLALEHGAIPGTVGLRNRNPKLAHPGIAIPTQLTPWPAADGRRMGVNSFGYGGSNAHVILEDARPHLQAAYETANGLFSSINRPILLPFSATTSLSLDARVDDICKSTLSHDIDLVDLAYTLGSRRSHLVKRGYLLVPPSAPLSQRLVASNLRTVPMEPSTEYQTCFVFSGQGAQWPGMGRELFDTFPVFRDAILEMDSILRNLPHAPRWKIEDVLFGDEQTHSIHDPLLSQPVCTALQVALARLLASWNVYPDAAIGHSSGEVGAAFAAGHLSVAESITIAYYRGYVAAKLCNGQMGRKGAMIAVGLSQEMAHAQLVEHNLLDRIQVACVNSPTSVTLSGDDDAIDDLMVLLQEQGVFNRKLVTAGMAYHSHHMLSVGEEYEQLLQQALPLLNPSSVRMERGAKFISSVTLDEHTQFAPSYWRKNLEMPTLFAPVMAKVLELANNRRFHVIELGPHSTMQLPISQIRGASGIKDKNLIYGAALKRFESASASMQSLAGFLWLHGRDIPFDEVNGLPSRKGNNPKLIHDLPPYRWEYKSLLWNESRVSTEFRMRKFPRHELLGSLMLGGNGLDPVWRNVLRIPDVPWLQDHRWEQTVVFPGVCYLSMATEAVRQIADIPWADRPSFELRNVHFVAALVLPTEPNGSVELFTALHPTSLTYATDSVSSWEFRISSFADGSATTHVRGSISLRNKSQPDQGSPRIRAPAESTLDTIAASTWYNRLTKVGANYGPAFCSLQNIYVPRDRKSQFCTTTIPLSPGLGDDEDSYMIHPISLDAIFQVCNMAATSGATEGLWAKVPTKVGFAVLHTPEPRVTSETEKVSILSSAKTVGFGTAQTCVEMTTASGQICGFMRDVRFAPYNKGSSVDEKANRHPMLRVMWKPDVLGLGVISSMHLNQLLEGFAGAPAKAAADGMAEILGVLDLVAHKRPDLRVLELANGESDATSHILDALNVGSGFMRLKSYAVGSWSQDHELIGHSVSLPSRELNPDRVIGTNEQFDLVLIPGKTDTEQISAVITNHLHPNGVVLGCGNLDSASLPGLKTVQCPLRNQSGELVLGQYTSPGVAPAMSADTKYIIVEQTASPLGEALMRSRQIDPQTQACRLLFDDLSADPIPPGCTVFFLVECQRSLLATATAEELKRVKLLTDNASQLVWITCGNLLCGSSPEMALVNGLSRAVMSEQPALKFFTYDIDTLPSAASEALSQTEENITAVLHQTSVTDFGFKQRNGVPTVSRFVPDDELNGSFRGKQGHGPVEMTLETTQSVQLNIARPGQLDTLYFDQLEDELALGPTDVQVQVKMVGLNAKDYYTVAGKFDTENGTSCLEYSGVVHKVGADVTRVAPGDRVVVMAPSQFKTTQAVPEWACARLLDGEELPVMSSMPIVYSTALYALHHRARIQSGESVLIHSGAGGVGMAAIEVALMAGAKVYTTVSSEEKREYLVRTFNLSPNCIFSSRDTSFLHDILETTHGRGVDVILNSLTGDLLHATWKVCAPFGRFVELGKLDFTDAGKLDMEHFLKDITFTAFDLTSLYNTPVAEYNRIWTGLLDQTLRLYRQGRIHGIRPVERFDISGLTQALRHFSSRNRMGKIVISLENPSSSIMVQQSKYQCTFSPDKVYVMVGCLGGLGRSISRWMVARGARRFIFLSRSGLRKPAARDLVSELESGGAQCTIIEGDVSNEANVLRTIVSAREPIGGVIQAAMGLSEALFTSMSHSSWHTGLSPKVQGTWNLHKALSTTEKENELDFFLLTSSISGTAGAATESNYCAANSFLDNFARYRRSQGLTATTIGLGRISEVGYLHENPEVEAMIERKGIHPITEDELLQVIDTALHSAPSPSQAYDTLDQAQILTGLEPFALQDLRKRGLEALNNPILTDQRAAILAAAVSDTSSTLPAGGNGPGDSNMSEIETSIALALQANGDSSPSLEETVLHHITKQFGNLILLPVAEVDVSKPLTKYGVDSMLAAELRAWFFQNFKVDIPFLTLLSKTCTVESLGGIVVAHLQRKGGEGQS